ncbi:MAG: hypothetical protein HY673_16165 [Chloroflexi bacterium]|nr:hypothetical protein [Chloroflexota bacterium]
MSSVIVENQFHLPASRQRVWDILGIAVMRSLPLEQMEAADEANFSAVLRVPMPFFRLSFNVAGVLELDPPNSLVCLIRGQSKWGLVQPTLRVSFALKEEGDNRTSIRFSAIREKKGRRNLVEWLLSRKERSFTIDVLNNVRKSLERLA